MKRQASRASQMRPLSLLAALWLGLLVLICGAVGVGAAFPPPELTSYTAYQIEGNTTQARLHHLGRGLTVNLEREGWGFGGWALGGRWRMYTRPSERRGVTALFTDAFGAEQLRLQLDVPSEPNTYHQLYDAPGQDQTLLVTVTNDGGACRARAHLTLLTTAGGRTQARASRCAVQTGYHWSPDGRWVAQLYEADAFRRQGVALMNTTTGAVRDVDLSNSVGRLFTEAGAWSGDGAFFALAAELPDRSGLGLYVLSTDGELNLIGGEDGFGSGLLFHWSGDGRLAYGRGSSVVSIYDMAAGAVVTQVETPLGTPAHPVGWMADGGGLLVKWDLFSSPGTDEALGIYADGVLSEIDEMDGTLVEIDWDPQGAHALLTIRNPTRTRLYLLEHDPWAVRPLTPSWSNNGRAAWSPDGTRVVTYTGPGMAPSVYVVRVNGAEQRQISPRGTDARFPVWVAAP